MASTYRFGGRSQVELGTCSPDLRRVAELAIARSPVDFGILEGHRDEQGQTVAFLSGASKLRWPKGRHNALPSRAFDFAPFPDPFDERKMALVRYGIVWGVMSAVAFDLGLALRWGGDWDGDGDSMDQTFNDLGHVELLDALPLVRNA